MSEKIYVSMVEAWWIKDHPSLEGLDFVNSVFGEHYYRNSYEEGGLEKYAEDLKKAGWKVREIVKGKLYRIEGRYFCVLDFLIESINLIKSDLKE